MANAYISGLVCVPTQQKCPQQGGAAVLLFLVTERVESIMEKICKNCQYFVQGSVSSPEYIWGNCMKPGKYVPDARDNEKRGIFTWADKTCSDFKPRQDLK